MQIHDRTTQNQILSFNKYAQFISEKFNVVVRFDGLEACTDGSVITLPNLIGMSQREIDFLYCILLHEVGHIRHSDFSKEAFSSIKTQQHFYLVNALEDARIENLLMKEYDGAEGIFDNLYNNFACDKAFMGRVFGNLPVMGLEAAVARYLHYNFIAIPKSPFSHHVDKKSLSLLESFIKESNLDEVIKKYSLNTFKDVLSLATEVYNLLYKTKSDTSEKISVQKMEVSHDESKDLADSALDNTKASLEKIDELSKKTQELKKEVNSLLEKHSAEISSLDSKAKGFEAALDAIQSVAALKNKLERKNKKLADLEKSKARQERLLNNTQERFKKRAPSVLGLDQKNELTKREQSAKEAVSKLLQKQKNYQDAIKEVDKSRADEVKEKQNLESELKKTSELLQNKTTDELASMANSIEAELERVKDQMEELTADIREKQKNISDMQTSMKSIRDTVLKEASQALKDLQEQMDKSGLGIQILPGFEATPGWEDSDEVQKEFDEFSSMESGEIVVNGASLNKKGMRDILIMLEKAKNGIDALDLGEVFLKKVKSNRLDSFNELTQVTNSLSEESETNISTSSRKHIPLTTQFDIIKNMTKSSGKEMVSLKVKNRPVIEKVKSVFKNKLKFQKQTKFKGNQEEGLLDSRSLWKLAADAGDGFYEKTTPKFVNTVAASIALDVSGSMDKEFTEYGLRLKELSLILSEGLSSCHVQHEILGFHAPVNHSMRAIKTSNIYNRSSNSLETQVFKGFSEKNYNGIENIAIQCSDNSDGESLKIVSNRLSKERARRKIVFIVTDGKPYLSDADVAVLDADLQNTLNELTKRGVEVFAIGFNDAPKRFYGDRYCKISSYQDLADFFSKKL